MKMRFWIPVIKDSKNNYDDLKENISELIPFRKDSKEVITIVAYIRNHEGVGGRFKKLVETRLKTFPNSRVYKVIYRCILNEERKIKKNMLEEFNQENWD